MILGSVPLGFHWPTLDPYLFCAYHRDAFPPGNGQLGPAASLAGRNIGMDFELRDGWRMYHGDKVPGFPVHPHRGFETVTLVREGLVDHADSLGAAGRYGNGDVQWMTAGRGVQHSEMFPLSREDASNPLLLFQLWLNLPAANKLVPPHFAMFWASQLPLVQEPNAGGPGASVLVVAGSHGGRSAPPPPPDSWAANPQAHVAIWLIELPPDARWQLPASVAGLSRMLYYYEGEGLFADEREVAAQHGLQLDQDAVRLHNRGAGTARLLFLQGKPIGEPVAQHGPFVMNTRQELMQAFADYQQDQFGGWPWPRPDQVHGQQGRFARHADGRLEYPGD